jgi:hypothetical protein
VDRGGKGFRDCGGKEGERVAVDLITADVGGGEGEGKDEGRDEGGERGKEGEWL